MKIYKNAIKIKSPDYYRKKYWHERCDPGENSVGEYSLSCNVNLITCTSGIKPHMDFESMCWLLVLHNQRYKFQYGRRLFKINPGDTIYFNLMTYHGLLDMDRGRRLFLGFCVDVEHNIDAEDIDSIRSEFSKHI